VHRYKTWNGPMPTTAAQQSVTTGTSIKTMLQLSTPATRELQVIAWGFSSVTTHPVRTAWSNCCRPMSRPPSPRTSRPVCNPWTRTHPHPC
jgi:hypothetical protein